MKLVDLLDTVVLCDNEQLRILVLDSAEDVSQKFTVSRIGLDHLLFHGGREVPLHLFEFYAYRDVAYTQYGDDGLFEIAVVD